MSQEVCPVKKSIVDLKSVVETGLLSYPRNRRIADEILQLLADVAWGRAGEKHLPAIESLAVDLTKGAEPAARDAADRLRDAIDRHREVFASHIQTHNCAAGDCVKLAPAPCQMSCPAGLDIPSYVTLIGMGRDAEAIDIIRRDCPFPWVCGLVCTRPCEYMCVRARIDTAVSIKSLKGFAAEQAMHANACRNPDKAPDQGRKVCVVGAGPGGMSAAYYLALKGYRVRVIEQQPVAGGMLLLGIPRYRLPREIIDSEVAMITGLGVEFRFNQRFGKDTTLAELEKEGFEAFFLAIGAHLSFTLGIPGEANCSQVIEAIDFLRDVALGDHTLPGRRVVVIGGGNVAIDAARTALRLGCDEVTIAYRRTRAEMPADTEEVIQAEEEGIRFEFLSIPTAVVCGDNGIDGLRCLRAKLTKMPGKDRMYPEPVAGSEFSVNCDVIISAIGQRVDADCLGHLKGLEWTRRNTIDVNMVTMETTVKGVFAAGDAVTGPATVIEAIGGGRRAAESIDRYLRGIPQPKMPPVPVRRGRIDWLEVSADTKIELKRPEMPLLAIDRRRTTFQQVELGYTEKEARQEARRCLRCDICLRCGKCVEICRDKLGVDALQMGYFDFDHPVKTDFSITAERCIACGACAANCPTGAMHMEDCGQERVLSLCGTILNRQRLLFCEDCGTALGTDRYVNYIRDRIKTVARVTAEPNKCEACARVSAAQRHTAYAPASFSSN